MEEHNNQPAMEQENQPDIQLENTTAAPVDASKTNSKMEVSQIAGAIVIAGIIIAGAVLLKDSSPRPVVTQNNNGTASGTPAEVTSEDRTLGNSRADVTVILYEDFQCPFCGAVSGLHTGDSEVLTYLTGRDPSWSPFVPELKRLANEGEILFVYRDFAFLGQESIWAASAAFCAHEQGKFWQYHDYLYGHQNGENQGAFTKANLKTFAGAVGLNQAAFDQCIDTDKYSNAVLASTQEGQTAGVRGTPKGFILKDGEVLATIDGAESWSTVEAKLNSAR